MGVILGVLGVRVPPRFEVGVPFPHLLRAVTSVGQLGDYSAPQILWYLVSKCSPHGRHFRGYRGYAYPHFLEWWYRTPTFDELSQLWNNYAIIAFPRFSGIQCLDVPLIGVILGGYRGYAYPHFLSGVPYPHSLRAVTAVGQLGDYSAAQILYLELWKKKG